LSRADHGVALLEALVALVVLALWGAALLGLVGGGLAAEGRARAREGALAAEDRVLAALTLLTASELARRVGRHPLGEFVVDIERHEPALYRIAVAQGATPAVADLVTVVYRPEASGAP
jgi:hypothetical protein